MAGGGAPSWLSFNDETVCVEPWEACKTLPAGAVSLTSKTTPEGAAIFSSKAAYMLCYTRRSVLRKIVAPPTCPPALRQIVADTDEEARAAATAYTGAIDERRRAAAELEDFTAQLTEGWTPKGEGDGRWVDAKWLASALTEPLARMGPMDHAPLLCAHGCADPAKVGSMKLVSSAAYAMLSERFGGGGPEMHERGCDVCCRLLISGQARETEVGGSEQ